LANSPGKCGPADCVDPTPRLALPQRAVTRRDALLDQQPLDTFRELYNNHRPHRALPTGPTPAQAYTARPKAATPRRPAEAYFRIRHDTVDQFGKLTLRHASRLRHLGIGRAHAGTPVLILVTTTTVTVISKTGHHLLSSHHIDADTNYWRNQNKTPADGRGICNP
jgi:hypothetical protein